MQNEKKELVHATYDSVITGLTDPHHIDLQITKNLNDTVADVTASAQPRRFGKP